MKISIVTTAYNVESYIEQCLSSILEQTYKNIEIIVVNDGSEDNTDQIVSKYSDNNINLPVRKTAGAAAAVGGAMTALPAAAQSNGWNSTTQVYKAPSSKVSAAVNSVKQSILK